MYGGLQTRRSHADHEGVEDDVAVAVVVVAPVCTGCSASAAVVGGGDDDDDEEETAVAAAADSSESTRASEKMSPWEKARFLASADGGGMAFWRILCRIFSSASWTAWGLMSTPWTTRFGMERWRRE